VTLETASLTDGVMAERGKVLRRIMYWKSGGLPLPLDPRVSVFI
jgi:hypothetical protein